jgi:hypothetical protein
MGRAQGRAFPGVGHELRSLLLTLALVVAGLCWRAPAGAADANHCGICGRLLGTTIYTFTDKVTREKVFACYECAICPDECYICGLPVPAEATKLPDGRFLCARDAKTAVLDEKKAKEVCEQIKDTLDRQFSRFLTLPSTNVSVALVDRVDLFDELAVVGNDFECPDILAKILLRNSYTRGQIHLFIAAEKDYGFNDILDWMRWGLNPRLKAADLGDVRNVEMPRPKSAPAMNPVVRVRRPVPVPAPTPTRLVLKGISSAKDQPLALINDQTMAVGESAKVRLGTTNVLVRCLAIGPRSVRIQVGDSGVVTELHLPESAGR